MVPWGSAVVLVPPLHVGHPQGPAPKAVLEHVSLPQKEEGTEEVELRGVRQPAPVDAPSVWLGMEKKRNSDICKGRGLAPEGMEAWSA